MGVYFWDSEYVGKEKGQYSQLMDEKHCSGGEGVWEDSAVFSFSLLGCIFIPAFGSWFHHVQKTQQQLEL